MPKISCLIFAAFFVFLSACSPVEKEQEAPPSMSIDEIAEAYVKLVLEVGLYDSDVVDAYYGPQEWQPAAVEPDAVFPHQRLSEQANELLANIARLDSSASAPLDQSRQHMLSKQLTAIATKINMINGVQYSFDEEAKALYDATPPSYELSYFDQLLEQLDAKVPGEGDLSERYNQYATAFQIDEDKLDVVFQAAIDEARKRTAAMIPLPENENFVLEYVKDKAWGGYNYYQGNSQSLIQINTDFPLYIDRAIDLAAHEGYPGHHVFNALLEQNLSKQQGWIEYSLYPLFSPQSLIAEGSANYGIDVAFPGESRIQFEKEVLFPLAGIDPAQADLYYEILALRAKLSYARNEVARAYINGDVDREGGAALVQKYLLMSPERALQSMSFIDKYRSYVINYNLGKDLVADFIEQNGGTADKPERRWEVFTYLLSNPYTASSMADKTIGK